MTEFWRLAATDHAKDHDGDTAGDAATHMLTVERDSLEAEAKALQTLNQELQRHRSTAYKSLAEARALLSRREAALEEERSRAANPDQALVQARMELEVPLERQRLAPSRADVPLPTRKPKRLKQPAARAPKAKLKIGASRRAAKDSLPRTLGNLVRAYSSTPGAPLDEPPPPAPAFWTRPTPPLPTAAGEHRVTWDLRYPTPPALSFDQSMAAVPEDTPFVPEGPLALPGDYRVTLTVDGVSETQPVRLKQDPRLDASPAAIDGMRRQLALSQQIIALMSASRDAYQEGHALESTLPASDPGAPKDAAPPLRERVAALTGTVDDASIGLSGGSYADAIPAVTGNTSFSRINGQASALLQMVESTSDQAPVASLYRSYADLRRDFDATLAAFRALVGTRNTPAGA
jgi:hypothetical protein